MLLLKLSISSEIQFPRKRSGREAFCYFLLHCPTSKSAHSKISFLFLHPPPLSLVPFASKIDSLFILPITPSSLSPTPACRSKNASKKAGFSLVTQPGRKFTCVLKQEGEGLFACLFFYLSAFPLRFWSGGIAHQSQAWCSRRKSNGISLPGPKCLIDRYYRIKK